MGKVTICIACIRVFTVREVQKVFFFSFRSKFKLVIVSLQIRIPLRKSHSTTKHLSKIMEVKNCLFCSLQQSEPWQSEFSKKTFYIITILVISFHSHLSSITQGFICFNRVSFKNIFFVKTSWIEIYFRFFFLPLEYWQSDNRNNEFYQFSSSYWKYKFSVTGGLVPSILVSAEIFELVEIDQQINTMIFPSHQNLDDPKNPKYATTFDRSRSLKSSFLATTGFFLPPSSQMNNFRFWKLGVVIIIFSVPCTWLRTVQECQEIFLKLESFQFSEPGFPININLISSFKVSIDCFLHELECLIEKSLNFYPCVESRWARTGSKCF